MISSLYRLTKGIYKILKKWRQEKEYKRKLAELKKRDPFNYKNF